MFSHAIFLLQQNSLHSSSQASTMLSEAIKIVKRKYDTEWDSISIQSVQFVEKRHGSFEFNGIMCMVRWMQNKQISVLVYSTSALIMNKYQYLVTQCYFRVVKNELSSLLLMFGRKRSVRNDSVCTIV